MTKNKRMEATAVTMLHAASEPADVNKAAMTEIPFCLIKPTWFNLYKRFLFPSWFFCFYHGRVHYFLPNAQPIIDLKFIKKLSPSKKMNKIDWLHYP